ncbi:MAG TPA: CBS domain-containing protein [Polyangiaceae bacterium]
MANEEARGLKIRSRQVYAAGDDPTIALGVQCPNKARDVDVEDCLRCRAFRELRVTADTQELTIACETEALPGSDGGSGTKGETASSERGTIRTIMTTDVVCVTPELSVAAVATLFLDRGISGAPVVDESGRAIGMVSKTDLVRHYSDADAKTAVAPVVGDIMMPMAFCLPANESIARAAALMAFEGMHRVPVANTRGQIVGLISSLDVLRWMAQEHGYVLGPRPRGSSAVVVPSAIKSCR